MKYRSGKPRRRFTAPLRQSATFVAEQLESRCLLSVNVLTGHNDLSRSGLDSTETQLTPADVTQATFGKLYTYPVDGQVYAQPLYVSNLTIPGKGTHDVVFIVTQRDSVYAFDADNPLSASGGGVLWQVSLGNPAASPPPNNPATGVGYFGSRYGPYGNITPWVGIVGTPVIDLSTNTMYVDAFTNDSPGVYVHRIHALDITSGADKLTPVVVQASVPGNGAGGNGTTVPFTATQEMQRPALTLVNGMLYAAYGSYADTDPYHGWVLGFDATTLQLKSVFNTTPNLLSPAGANPDEGAVWQSGAGLVSDGSNLYFMAGNGDFNSTLNSQGFPANGDFGDSFLKLSTAGGTLSVSDYFTPSDELSLAINDEDLGSGGPMLLPTSVGSAAHPDLLVGCGKEGTIYLIDISNMGKFAGTDHIVQEVSLGNGTWSNPAYFNGRIYYQGSGGVIKAFSISNGRLSTTPVAQGSTSYGYPGATPSISANGTTNGIVWNIQSGGILHAYDATTLQELYNSSQAGSRDALGSYVNYVVPTVADGKVFVGTGNSVAVFGLFPPPSSPPAAPVGLTATQGFGTAVTLAWTNAGSNVQDFQVQRSTDGTTFTQIATVPGVALGAPAAYTDTNTTVGQTYSYRVLAFNLYNGGSTSAPSNVARLTISTPAVTFLDNYSTNTINNYVESTQTAAPTFADSWTVANGRLNYTISANNGWNSSVLLLRPGIASTAGLSKFTTSGDLIAPQNYQAGLILSGDTTNGGFVVQEFDNGQYNNHLVLLRETGGELLGDEGGTGNPPVLADFGDISQHGGDTFQIAGTIDRTGASPVIAVTITDLTTPSFTIATQTVVDSADPASFGGAQIGWRARYQDTTAAFGVDNLSLQLPAADHPASAPSGLTATQGVGTNIILRWTNTADNALEFEVQRSTDGTNFNNIATVPAVPQNATATYTDTPAIVVGQTLYYRVLAFNGYNGGTFSAPSNVASIVSTLSTVNFRDTYNTDTTRHYVATDGDPTGTQDSWTVSNGTLNYAVQSSNGAWNSSVFLLDSNVANSGATPSFTTSGDIVAPGHTQPGLILAGDTTNGGFVVQEFENTSPPNYLGHLVLLRETGGELLGDEGGTGNPPVLLDLGDISQHLGDTFRVAGTIDRTGTNPVITVSVTDLTDPTFVVPGQTVTDAADPANFGGDQIGWRVRSNSATATASFDHLGLQSTATGSQDVITDDGGDQAVVFKQIDGGYIQWAFGSLVGTLAVNDPRGLTVNDLGGPDTIELDPGAGAPLPNLLLLNGTFSMSDVLDIATGQKIVLPRSATPGANALTLHGLDINPGGTLDIGNGAVTVNYSGASPLASIQGLLASAMDGGAWDGTGITSSTLAGGGGSRAIADVDIGAAVKLTLALNGDADGNGTVAFADLLVLAQDYNRTGQDWSQGDFNYDGKVNFADLLLLAQHYNPSAATTTATAAADSADLLRLRQRRSVSLARPT